MILLSQLMEGFFYFSFRGSFRNAKDGIIVFAFIELADSKHNTADEAIPDHFTL